MLLVSAFLLVMGAIVFAMDARRSATRIEEGLPRNGYGQGSHMVELTAAMEGGIRTDISVEVSERAYTKDEIQELFRRCTAVLDQTILGENESLDRIETNMDLAAEVPGEPVDVSWELDRYDVMNVYGEIQPSGLDREGTMVNLKAILTYQEDETQQALYECTAMVYPRALSKEQEKKASLEETIQKQDQDTQTKERLALPRQVGGETVSYYPRLDPRGLVIMVLAVLTGFLLYAKEKQDRERLRRERKEQMIRDYPEVVSKLTLFLGAGMTVKRAWKKIVQDYEAAREAKGERCIYEEMAQTCREMDSGIMESESYERFGRRCQVQEYMRLGALLSQNLRKGTKGLTQMLRMEAIQAFEERKARAKRLGEEAGTKLLAPMFLMLAVVLVIVIVPAFLSIQL